MLCLLKIIPVFHTVRHPTYLRRQHQPKRLHLPPLSRFYGIPKISIPWLVAIVLLLLLKILEAWKAEVESLCYDERDKPTARCGPGLHILVAISPVYMFFFCSSGEFERSRIVLPPRGLTERRQFS